MKKNKLIVFDTNAILTNPSLLENYKDTTVIAKTVLDELDYRKTKPEHQERSQLALNIIKDKDIRISVSSSSKKTNNNDEKILLDILEDYSLDSFLLVTDDTGMQLRAKTHGIKSLKLFEFLSENSKHESLTSFHKEMFEHLVKNEFDSIVYGEDINFNSFNFYLENGNTPLIEMVRANNKPAIEYLVKFPGMVI